MPSDTREQWTCPTCKTVHLVTPGRHRICFCGTMRQKDGTEHMPTRKSWRQAAAERRTQAELAQTPSGLVLRWGRALARWIRHGRPVRTEEQIAGLFRICSACPMYVEEPGACSICGCHVSLSDKAMFNKLAMGTEGCPIGKFEPTVELKGRHKANCGGCGGGSRREKKQRRKRRRRREGRSEQN